MAASLAYEARPSDAQGNIAWSEVEHQTWQRLITRQTQQIQDKACDEYLQGLACLQLPTDHIPNLSEVSAKLFASTTWQCEAVPALISFDRFFALLAAKKFPVASFIRRPEDLDYLQEPDIFHEIFGHCAMLTHPAFAQFTEAYGKLGLRATSKQRAYLARLYWFTVEFGLVQTDGGSKIFGGGILSSPKETEHAFSSPNAKRREFDMLTVLRTPYQIDHLQPVYYQLPSIEHLYALSKRDIMQDIAQAEQLGLLV